MSAGTGQRPFPKASRFGPYKIASSIGVGGMGEVSRARARDTRLNRDVAVMLLPADCQTKFGRREAPCQQRQSTAPYRCEIEGQTLP